MIRYALLLVISLNTVPTFGSTNYEKEDTFKLVTLNTWMIPFLRKKANTRSRLIGKYAKEYDFVLLQEVFNRRQRAIITAHINNDEKFYNRYQRTPFLRINSGLFNLSKYKIITSSFKRFSRCGQAQCWSGKGVLHTRVRLSSGLELDLYNTHLQPFISGKDIRKSQILETLNHIERTNNGKRAAILVGDFNISGRGAEYSSLMEQLENFGFFDVWTSLNYNKPGYTWDSSINTWSQRMDGNYVSRLRFDYIFVKNGSRDKIELLSSDIVFDRPLSMSSKSRKYFLSDHFGVDLKFRINQAKENE